MVSTLSSEQQPLLKSSISGTGLKKIPPLLQEPFSPTSYANDDTIYCPEQEPSREIEDDVLPETSPLGRTLTRRSVYLLIISRVIGSGIFATPGAILRAVGSPGLALSLWVVGAIVAACALSISLEYGCMLPRSGGDKVYLEFTYRHPRYLASSLVATAVVLLGFTASNCIVFSEYVLFAFGREDAAEFVRKGIAVGLLAAVTVVHGVFPRTGLKLQNFLGYVKIATIVFMILCGLYVVVWGPSSSISAAPSQRSQSARTGIFAGRDGIWAGSVWNWGVIATSLFKVTYSFGGLENANNVLNEVKDPVRTLKFATRAALATVCCMYLLVNLAYLAVVPLDDIKASGELIAALFFERILGPQVGRVVLPFAVALSATGNVLVVAFSASRLKQEVARQGLLPCGTMLSSTRPFGSPLGALLLNFVVSTLVLVLPPSTEVYSFILEVESYPGQFFALASAGGLLYLRHKKPELKRPFRAWIPAVVLRIVLCLALIAAPFFPPATAPENGMFYAMYAVVGFSVIIVGVLYWYAWTKLIPKLLGLRLEEKTEVLPDGVTITKYVHVPAA